MLHVGDVTKINGAEVPIVDIVTGGSPCQDLSVAGKRAGLAGERSGLFMEQIRVIKEMREHDRSSGRADVAIRPRFMVWENVPGAFSSNHGEDFRAVLEETAKIADSNAVIPEPPKGKWTHAGCIMGDGWSIAWRVHDAQFWGVPQRRKRISLVADFGGTTAPEILFERKGVSGDITESGEEGKDVAEDAGAGTEETGGAVVYGISAYDSNAMKSDNPHSGIYEADTSRTLDLNGGSPACNQGGMAVVCLEGNGSRPSHRGDGFAESETMYTLNSTEHHAVAVENHPADSRVKISEDGMVQTLSGRMGTGGNNVPMVMEEPLSIGHDIRSARFTDDGITDPLTATDYKDPIKITYQKVTGTVDCGLTKGTGNQLANSNMFVSNGAIVRRLTPMECERLQGFPDYWTDIGDWVDSKGKKHKGESDSPRYKALGNSIALPFWEWMAKRMVRLIKNDEPTMASLFDGIGGFPLSFSRAGVKPVWCSEIEEFPIAVTKIRFPD